MTKVQLLLDWDGTLTLHDTILHLSKIGYTVNERNGRQLKSWDNLVRAYLEDLNSHDATYTPKKDERRYVAEESKYLASLSSVELKSIKRIEEAGVFTGTTKRDLQAGATASLDERQIEMRPGWEELFKLANLDFAIVTVNWSAMFIRCCLSYASEAHNVDTKRIERMMIWGNEIEGVYDEARSTGSTGSLTSEMLVHTSFDKAELMEGLIEDHQTLATETGENYVSIYVGDTTTDFDALLLTDIGICVRDEPLRGGQKVLADTFERLGVAVRPLEEVKWPQSHEMQKQKTVYWTQHLSAVAQLVLRLQRT